MSCGFCFATFLDLPGRAKLDYLPEAEGRDLIDALRGAGFGKINFAGGEPTLCSWLSDLIRYAKSIGFTTSIVTNGSGVSEQWLDGLDGCLDILALSIDSVDGAALLKIGRVVNGQAPMGAGDYRRIGDSVRRRGIRLKVNTVVNRYNLEEDFRPFIRSMQPERWKIFQALPIDGQNDERFDEFSVSDAEFERYVARNGSVADDGIRVVPENNELMTASYLMVDPLGRFFDNAQGRHTYSRPILEVGVAGALTDVEIRPDRFALRGGLYQ